MPGKKTTAKHMKESERERGSVWACLWCTPEGGGSLLLLSLAWREKCELQYLSMAVPAERGRVTDLTLPLGLAEHASLNACRESICRSTWLGVSEMCPNSLPYFPRFSQFLIHLAWLKPSSSSSSSSHHLFSLIILSKPSSLQSSHKSVSVVSEQWGRGRAKLGHHSTLFLLYQPQYSSNGPWRVQN